MNDTSRANLAYPSTNIHKLDGRYIPPPGQADLNNIAFRFSSQYGDRTIVLIPMAEQDPSAAPVIRSMVRHLRDLGVSQHQLLIATAGAAAANIQTAAQAGATTIAPDRLFDALNWRELLPLLGLHERPRGRAGKGWNVLGGYMAMWAMDRPSDVIHLQSDAEIRDYGTYAALEHLMLAAERVPGARHLKMAKAGRGNETVKSAVNALRLLTHLPVNGFSDEVKDYARQIYLTLRDDPWMLTGEWLWLGDHFLQRPFATGYVEETLQAMWCSAAAPHCTWEQVRYVGNPQPRHDGDNAEDVSDKVAIMLAVLSQYLQALCFFGKPIHTWTIDDYRRFNTVWAVELNKILVIGPHGYTGPMMLKEIRPEVIIPPIPMLIEAGLLDGAKLRELHHAEITKYQAS